MSLARPLRLVSIVVTHNRLAQLQQTVTRLLESPAAELAQLVVVDNASEDGTAEWLGACDDPRLIHHRQERNLGGAGGFEAGMRIAMERFAPDWIVLMDDDARPEPGALAQFGALERAGWDVLAAAVYHPGGEICDINRPSLNPFWRPGRFVRTVLQGLMGRARDGFHLTPQAYQTAEIQEIDAGSFVGLFISAQVIERAGYPDGGLFIYGDDVLYCLRLRQLGHRIGFAPKVQFEHDFQTLSGPVQRFQPLWKAYYNHRNLVFVYRHAAGLLFWPVLVAILPKWWLKSRHYGDHRPAFRRLIRAAIRDGLRRDLSRPHEEVVALATVVEDIPVKPPNQQ